MKSPMRPCMRCPMPGHCVAIGRAKEKAGWTMRKAIEKVIQLNEWRGYSCARAQLIVMLDKAMAIQDTINKTADETGEQD